MKHLDPQIERNLLKRSCYGFHKLNAIAEAMRCLDMTEYVMINLTINNKKIVAEEDMTILEVAKNNILTSFLLSGKC